MMVDYRKFLLFLLLLALCLAPALAPRTAAAAGGRLIIAEREAALPPSGGVTYENTGREDSSWWLSCTEGAYTLTLSNAGLAGGIISTLDSLTVCVPEGTRSTISAGGNGISATGSLRLTGGGTLVVDSSATSDTAAVCATNTLTVSGTQLEVNSSSATGIWGNVVVIEDSTVQVRVNYGGSADCAGIFGYRLAVSRSEVTATVSGAAIARAIFSYAGRLLISDARVVAGASAVNGGVGIAAQDGIAISGGKVIATAKSDSVCAVGIDSWSPSLPFTVAGGDITAAGFCTAADRNYAYGIRAHVLHVGGGAINATGTDGGITAGIYQTDGITLGDAVQVQAGGSIVAADNGAYYFQTFTADAGSLAFLDSGYVTGGASPVILQSSLPAPPVPGVIPGSGEQTGTDAPGPGTAQPDPATDGAVETPPEQVPTLAYVPLDNRTVNVDRVIYAAEAAGFKVLLPPEDLYATRLDGQPRNANGTGCGDGKALLAWIKEMDQRTDYFVLSLDQLLSGGLVNSRVMTNTDLAAEYAIIDALVELAQHNQVYILDTVVRLATCTLGYQGGDAASYNYLRAYNLQARKELTGNMLTVDRIIAGYARDEKGEKLGVRPGCQELVRQALRVRERKLRLADYIFTQDKQGKITYFIGVDDSSSQPTVQTNEINYIRMTMGGRGTLYSGTDELGMMAVLRLMLDYYGSNVKAAPVYFGGTEYWDSGSAYDVESIRENVRRHLDSVGVAITDRENADVEIVVLTSPARTVMNAKYITQMLDYINQNIAAGVPTIVINPVPEAYSNNFEYRLIHECETSMLLAYSSWNTAGNAIGLAIGNGISRYLYLQSRSASSDAADTAFLKGLVFSMVKDISYLRGGGKALFTEYLMGRGWSTDNFYVSAAQAAQVGADLETLLETAEYNVTVNDICDSLHQRRYLKGLGGECGVIGNIALSNFSAPFCRTFEIRCDIDVALSDITMRGYGGDVTVSLPYTPAAGELVYSLNVYYRDAAGIMQRVPGVYDPATGRAEFTGALAGIFLSSMSVRAETVQTLYTDVPAGAWYYRHVLYTADKGLMRGTGAGTFAPEAPMNRAMFIAVLHRIAAPDTFWGRGWASPFADVTPGDWYYDPALWAFAGGIVTGGADSRLGAADHVTRQEAAVLMYRLAAYLREDVSRSGDLLADFTDGEVAPAYARAALEWAVERGIISGVSSSELSPGGAVTRAQAAAMFQRLCGVLGKDG